MKPIGEEQQEVASALNDRAVVDYLLQHPEFFIRNAAQVEHLRVPHPVRGTISLVEWHMMRARNHIHVLEENIYGEQFSTLSSQAIRCTRTRVLPLPAPARTSILVREAATASRCLSLRLSSR